MNKTTSIRTGRTIKEVVTLRQHRRIGLPPTLGRWTAREIRLLGRLNDAELGRRLRRPQWAIRRQRLAECLDWRSGGLLHCLNE